MFKCFKNQSDTYHDTQTHDLMEQDTLLLQDQAGVMDIVDDDTWIILKKRGPFPSHAQVVWLSVVHV
jgi:hypothetical protein